MPSLLQFSDLHLDRDHIVEAKCIEAMRESVRIHAPDAIVFTGDLVDRGPTDPDSVERGRALLESFGPPFYVVPGNHDIGSKLSIGEHAITPGALSHWKRVFGSDCFSHQLDGIQIVGLNTQIVGSGMSEEVEQLHWLDQQIGNAERSGLQIALFMHMPLYLSKADELDVGGTASFWAIDYAPRQQLLARLQRPEIQLVASGHTHWHAAFPHERPMRIWSPSLSHVVSEASFPPDGGCIGFMRYTIDQGAIGAELIRVAL